MQQRRPAPWSTEGLQYAVDNDIYYRVKTNLSNGRLRVVEASITAAGHRWSQHRYDESPEEIILYYPRLRFAGTSGELIDYFTSKGPQALAMLRAEDDAGRFYSPQTVSDPNNPMSAQFNAELNMHRELARERLRSGVRRYVPMDLEA